MDSLKLKESIFFLKLIFCLLFYLEIKMLLFLNFYLEIYFDSGEYLSEREKKSSILNRGRTFKFKFIEDWLVLECIA